MGVNGDLRSGLLESARMPCGTHKLIPAWASPRSDCALNISHAAVVLSTSDGTQIANIGTGSMPTDSASRLHCSAAFLRTTTPTQVGHRSYGPSKMVRCWGCIRYLGTGLPSSYG